MMKTKIVMSFLLAVMLSACASTDSGTNVAAKDDSEKKVYVTGSFLSRKASDASVSTISGDDIDNLRTNITPANTPIHP
jgi:hypothetical protein